MRRKLTGTVVGDKNDKTRIVEVKSVKRHLKYDKVIKSSKKFHCHDEKNVSSLGDRVVIMESRPFSKLKKWALVKVIK